MRVPADAQLSRTRSGQPIGYKLLGLEGAVIQPFTRDGVTETGIPGHYMVAGGVEAPAGGCYIVWGDGRADFAQASIDPMPSFDITTITRRLDAMVAGLERSVAVGELASDQSETVAELLQTQGSDIAAVRAWCDQVAGYGRLAGELDAMQTRLGRLFGQPSGAVASSVGEMASDERRQYEQQIATLQTKLTRAVGAIDRFLVQTGG